MSDRFGFIGGPIGNLEVIGVTTKNCILDGGAEARTSEELPEVPERFAVHDSSSANWLIRKIVECRVYAKRCEEWFEQERRRALREEESLLFRYGAQLIEFTRAQIAANGGRRKSLNLPAGTVGFRAEPAKLIVDDEIAVIAWAKQHNPAIVSIIERLSKSALNAHVEQTGEIPSAGVHMEAAREKFYVR